MKQRSIHLTMLYGTVSRLAISMQISKFCDFGNRPRIGTRYALLLTVRRS
jgi:hypothetical protein